MKQILILLIGVFGALVFTLCTKIDKSGNQEKYESEIISQTLPELLRPKYPPPPPPFVGTEIRKAFNDSIEKVKADFERRVDTTVFIVHLNDKLVLPDTAEFSHLQDSAYNGLLGKLRADTLKPKSIQFSVIDSLCEYTLQAERPPEFRKMGFTYLGSAFYSRMVFDANYTHALFYFVGYWEVDDGSGSLIYVENKNGKWVIKRHYAIWIS
ncbi:hypothetical protein [uncultured Draconibacterium sp.]|uniref:hypothetical protein n=1 Tax=uncultured Draconibacterium sp. TaxID=1573823 RepID=UPI0025F51F7B|nr:hypothetical protein [uncultured Draconibacterium sp.]